MTAFDKLLSNLVYNLSDINCEKCDDKREYIAFRDKHILSECSHCITCFKKDSKKLIKRFANTYEFCNGDINKSILLLRKDVCPYEYMDSWEGFDEKSLLGNEAFYNSLNREDIIDVDYRHANKVFKTFRLKHHDLYVQSDTLLLGDVFENFGNMCIKVYELDPAHFLSASGLAWKACLKKTEVKLELLTDVDMLLMVEKGIRGGICHAMQRYAKAKSIVHYTIVYYANLLHYCKFHPFLHESVAEELLNYS